MRFIINRIVLILLISIFLTLCICLTYSKGSKIATGFINDNYSTSFYYDEDNYYNDGWHLIDDNGDVYQLSFLDVANSDVAIFLNKKETVDELTKGFEIDYNQVFNEWYIKSKTDITSQLNAIASNLTVQKVNKVREEVSRRVKECKKIGAWYNERLYDAKKIDLITKDIHKTLSRKLQKDMSEYINRFREEMGSLIKSM